MLFRLLLTLTVIPLQTRAEIPAFPGAEGFGARTPGGRGGEVIEVTNLDGGGPGSFKAAVSASGPRIVVFRVGGVIEQNEIVKITNPYITIAGQTAPGDGIVFRGMLSIHTHDVVVRGMRFRLGDDLRGIHPDKMKGIEIWPPRKATSDAYNVVLDHNSFSWGTDESGLGVGSSSKQYGTHDVTVSWNIFAEGLNRSTHSKGKHAMGFTFHYTSGNNLSAHHNLLAHNHNRNPNSHGGNTEIVNNVVYNWGYQGMNVRSNPGASIIGCYFKPGPSTMGGKKGITGNGGGIYVEGNIGPGRDSHDDDEWEIVQNGDAHRLSQPVEPRAGITATDAETAYEQVLNGAGALPRDPVDARVVLSVREGKGSIINSQRDVGGLPSYKSGTAPADSDHDGMPDAWEKERGLDPRASSDGKADRDGDGYTNVEEYINSFFLPPSGDNPPSGGERNE